MQELMNKKLIKQKQLIEENENKDDNFDRAEFYKYFKVDSDNKLSIKQRELAIKLLEKRLKK